MKTVNIYILPQDPFRDRQNQNHHTIRTSFPDMRYTDLSHSQNAKVMQTSMYRNRKVHDQNWTTDLHTI